MQTKSPFLHFLVVAMASAACGGVAVESSTGSAEITEGADAAEQGTVASTATDYYGDWSTKTSHPVRGFARLSLRIDGTFAADIDVSAMADCAPAGAETRCLTPSVGRFQVLGGGTKLRLETEENGRVVSDETMGIRRRGDRLTLSRVQGRTEVLTLEAATGGADAGSADSNDCFGAWRDERGTCRSPNDGVYPASCCVGL